VGKDGAVEQAAVVDGPAALHRAAIDAVKQWKFKPWLVNGIPVEVDTTVSVEFSPRNSQSQSTVPGVASLNGLGTRSPVEIDWEADRRTVALPPVETAAPVTTGTTDERRSMGSSPGMQGASTPAGTAQLSNGVSLGSPEVNLPGTARARTRSGGTEGAQVRPRSGLTAAPANSILNVPSMPTGTVLSNGGRTEWRLLKKVAPVYPQDAVDAGIEGVVLVSGIVKTDGMLRDLLAVSGPAPLRQAAVDAAAQYVYEPILHGDELGEAKTRVPVAFTLSGPAKVPAEVMAGRIVNSYTPPYPPDAIEAGIGGAVILHVLIGREGEVKAVRVVSGREMLRAAAVDAVKQWRYQPYKRNGVDVEVETDVEVQFTLLKE
jgi:TonB family protein